MFVFMKAKKSLGQYFLNSPSIIADIVKAGNVEPNDLILEIGPGRGILTEVLLKIGAKVIAVEKDGALIPELQKKFVKEISLKQLNLIHADILDIELPHITNEPYKIIANIPYYITGQILRTFLESDKQPTRMTLLVQKEVAERIVAKPSPRSSVAQSAKGGLRAKDGKESLLSLSVKIFGEPKIIRTVGKGAFTPQPNVDSAVLNIENIPTLSRLNLDKVGGVDTGGFFELIHLGFRHKRKQLLPNLTSSFKKEILVKAFEKCGVNLKTRAEDLPLETWLQLCNTITK